MIRKTIIVVLTLGAVGTSLLWISLGALDLGPWFCDRGPVTASWYDNKAILIVKVRTGTSIRLFAGGRTMSVGCQYRVSREQAVSRWEWGFGGFRVWGKPSRRLGHVTIGNTLPDEITVWGDNLTSQEIEYLSTTVAVFWTASIPYWGLILLFATYPAIAFIRGPLRRWQRRRKGLCLNCGYDLTGNVSGTCPECGKQTHVKGCE